ncbi:hypothetical protein HPB50_023349 [Hyalomma asiaticum]|uniref:Uncharacterized protein n=1 Tax=Hyalomma asiaticum TaxID=266040 RepID=A0ACB7TN01_HYAAI|nr:hypothetical protein HPB50_023349 [Hyalomma asiaticum]
MLKQLLSLVRLLLYHGRALCFPDAALTFAPTPEVASAQLTCGKAPLLHIGASTCGTSSLPLVALLSCDACVVGILGRERDLALALDVERSCVLDRDLDRGRDRWQRVFASIRGSLPPPPVVIVLTYNVALA